MPRKSSVPKAGKAPNFEADLKAAVAERAKLENELVKAQEKLREVDRQKDPEKFAQLLQPVNEKKQQIGDISQRHVELARMVSAMKGGTNHLPPPG